MTQTEQPSGHGKLAFPLILATAFLDVLGLGILIPAFPFLVESYGMGPEWLGYTLSINSLGMFFGGYALGKLSDSVGRRNVLLLTTFLNFLGYVFVIHSPTFLLFVIGRFIAGLGASGFAITQAYVSDISTKSERAHRMGMMGAMFGLGFLVGPVIGGVLSSFGLHMVGYGGALAVLVNFLLVLVFLPEPKKHHHIDPAKIPKSLHLGHPIVALLVIAFLSTIAFSPIQGMSSQFYHDRFGLDPKGIAMVLAVIGLTAIVYQGFLIRFVRKRFSDAQMLFLGLAVLMVAYVFQATNVHPVLMWFILPFFPLGMGSVQPAIGAMISHEAKGMAGKYLGLNTSVMSLGNIIGPALAGWLYAFSMAVPYWVGIGVFALAIPFAAIAYRNETRLANEASE